MIIFLLYFKNSPAGVIMFWLWCSVLTVVLSPCCRPCRSPPLSTGCVGSCHGVLLSAVPQPATREERPGPPQPQPRAAAPHGAPPQSAAGRSRQRERERERETHTHTRAHAHAHRRTERHTEAHT